MISSIRMMMTCRWSARRIQRYLDADPASPLSGPEIKRLEAHVATCERCSAELGEMTAITVALARLAERRSPDAARVDRLITMARKLPQGDH